MSPELDKPHGLVGYTDQATENGPRKLTRAQKREANRIAKLQAETLELAQASGIPPTLIQLQQAAAENHAALVAPKGGDMLRATERDSTREEIKRPPGRPSEYTEDQGDELCAWIAAGGSLRAWCRDSGRDMQTVYRWLRQDAQFHARYARAHEDRADTLADEMLEIADDAATDATIEGVAAAKLRVEARKWIASKLRPTKWGDKQVIEHQGNVSIRIGIPQKPLDMPAQVVDVTPARAPSRLTR